MKKRLEISLDFELIEEISAQFDLRAPNKEALIKLVSTLEGDYAPSEMQVMNIATGVGKTYLMAAFIEYLRRQNIYNVVVVTPGKIVQSKTVLNFSPGTPSYIQGSPVPPDIVIPQDYSAWIARTNENAQSRELPVLVFIFNIQQLIAPTKEEGDTHGGSVDAMRRRPRRFDENAGVLFDYLKDQTDLVVIADESHLYSISAAAFNSALREMEPAAAIGLTASVTDDDHVIYRYPLYRAIQDKYVKAPVLAFRKSGYDNDLASEEQQLKDALQLRGIKQAYYDAYTDRNSLPHMNAVVFVVCSDIDHATQVTNLLRSPEYFGRELAVLQVDSEHDDYQTQTLLERLDEPDSKVLAVVSVNKLKEGWDVKNIAVIVTLRAMASEVLTQQTMGRGMRLPFGKYTDVWQIDQLDIIAHQSFKELLEAENVLKQFGLEEAVREKDKAKVKEAVENAVNTVQDTAPQNTDPERTDTSISISPDTNSNEPGVKVRVIESEETNASDSSTQLDSWVKRNTRFGDVLYKFPVTNIELTQPRIELSEISVRDIVTAASRVTSSGEVLYRKEIVVSLGKTLKTYDAESAEVDSITVSNKDANLALIKLVMNMSIVPKTPPNINYTEKFMIPKFMESVKFQEWTVKSISSARHELQSLIKEHVDQEMRKQQERPVLVPKKLPGGNYLLPIGQRIYDLIQEQGEFVRGRYYGPWLKSLFLGDSFDSYTGEYQLARLLDTSPKIKWWHRLLPHDNAYIYYNSKDRYFPDFVALDSDSTYWIIEGKSEIGKHDEKVQAKRKAAETLVQKLSAEIDFSKDFWGYLIAYENDILKADTWEDLKAMSQPISNIVSTQDK